MMKAGRSADRFALPVLILGAVMVSFSGIFVKLSEVGPTMTGFYRMFLALPIFAIWVFSQRGAPRAEPRARKRAFMATTLAGISLAVDLIAWHWCLKFASVAAATLMGNTAPIWMAAFGFAFLGERFGARFLLGMAAALGGVWLLLAGGDKGFDMHSSLAFVLGMAGAITYAAYLRSGKEARRSFSTAEVMFWGSLVASIVLLPVGLLTEDKFIPQSLSGWGAVLGLALVSQTIGQTMINWAVAHLPAAFSSLTLLINPLASAVFAWILLNEGLSHWQILGGIVVLAGIFVAKPRANATAKETRADD
jgi:drug/metabolite transporter (DMT)-like permease